MGNTTFAYHNNLGNRGSMLGFPRPVSRRIFLLEFDAVGHLVEETSLLNKGLAHRKNLVWLSRVRRSQLADVFSRLRNLLLSR